MFLILDFTQSLKLAIISQDKLIHKELKTKKNISEILIAEIDHFFKKSEINIKTIKSIYIITGPGSFTGIRSALTFAKSLKLTMKLDIFGLSKFQIINFSRKLKKTNRIRCIILHFRKNQFFTQSFQDNKAINNARLVNFDYEKFKFNRNKIYIYDSVLFEAFMDGTFLKKTKENSLLVDYNLNDLQNIIVNNMIDIADPKPLYISNFY